MKSKTPGKPGVWGEMARGKVLGSGRMTRPRHLATAADWFLGRPCGGTPRMACIKGLEAPPYSPASGGIPPKRVN